MKKRYLSMIIFAFMMLSLLSACGNSDNTHQEKAATNNSQEETTTTDSQGKDTAEEVTDPTLSTLVDEFPYGGQPFIPSDFSFPYTEVATVYETNGSTSVIYAGEIDTNKDTNTDTYSYYLTTLNNRQWSEPEKLFDLNVGPRGHIDIVDNKNIFSKKPDSYVYPIQMRKSGINNGIFFDGNKMYVIYPSKDSFEIENIAIQKVEFDEKGNISKNNIIYTGPYLWNPILPESNMGEIENLTNHDIIQTSDGEYIVSYSSNKKNKEYRKLGDTLGNSQPIKDNYQLLKTGEVLYIDFKKELAYVSGISDVGINETVKMLNLKTGEPVYENGKDKFYDTGVSGDVKIFPDVEKKNYLYVISSSKLIVIDKDLNEVSTLNLPDYKFIANNETFFSFYNQEEFERKQALKRFMVMKLGQEPSND